MTAPKLILSGARFYWRTHLGVILGSALAAMVLTGSLLVGDSVKATLRRQALDRVGNADVAMTGGDRFFRAALADAAGAEAAPVLALRATVARADGGARVNAAQLLGVDARFWKLSPSGAAVDLPGEGVALNARLAQQLGVAAGDMVIVRVEKPGMFSKDAPLSGEENEVVALRVKIARVVGDEDYGRFALTASQVPPFTVFTPLKVVQEKIGMPGKANLLINGNLNSAEALPKPSKGALDLHEFTAFAANRFGDALSKLGSSKAWTLQDFQLEVRDLPNNSGLELRTSRVFLDPPVVAAAPPGKAGRRVDSLTYFVNELRAGDKATPYSMVTAVEAQSSGFPPAKLADNEIVISQWEADDLGISTGAKVTVKYFTMSERRQLEEKAHEFTVVAVLPMSEPQLNGSWMPDFPGLKDAKNCRDWKPGFAIDMTKMREKDNDYWLKYRGTPKAFVNLKVGQEMWGNRWGNTTALRWPAGTERAEIETALREKLTPEMLGFQFLPLREQALAATKAPVDFGELFMSFSFFLIAAAAVLTGLLFVFALEQRNAEAGLLLALGWRPKQVRRLFLAEGAVLALVGSVIGVAAAIAYTKLVLRALATVWQGAVGAVRFEFAADPATLPIGLVSGVVIALLAMWLASRRQLRHSARELLSGTDLQSVSADRPGAGKSRGRKSGFKIRPTMVAAVALGLAVVMPFFAKGAEAFFGAGTLLLIGGLALAWQSLRSLATASGGLHSIPSLGVRNAARRRGRSLATIAVLASGVFMVVAVDSFRHQPLREGDTRDPGTGGFALVGESALPIYEDLNSPKGREAYGLDAKILEGTKIVPMRVRDGDDASCLNLNRALQPRLLGVKAADLDGQSSFLFAPNSANWNLLHDSAAGIVDANTLQWALQKSLGESIEYRDYQGQVFPVRLAATLTGSILQGSVVISEEEFVRRFPNSGGYRFFLIACPPEKTKAVREHLSRQLTDRGLELVTTAQRLGEFQAVENTYLSIFQALGGLGLLLGSAGLAIVVARNVLERRREFGLLAAVGFRASQLRQLVFAEHRRLIAAALLIGTVSALLGVWPNLGRQSGGFPFLEVALLLVALTLGCLFWTWLATRLALRGSGVAALRSE